MKCPTCNVWTEVRESHHGVRRRECGNGHRFTTVEVVKVEEPSGRTKAIADAVAVNGMTVAQAAELFGVQSSSYVYRCIKEHYVKRDFRKGVFIPVDRRHKCQPQTDFPVAATTKGDTQKPLNAALNWATPTMRRPGHGFL